MKFAISVLDRAWADADRIFEWIAAKSPQGAIQWNQVFDDALVQLESHADENAVAPEHSSIVGEIRQSLFKTRHGRTYRLIYTIVGNEVRVLRVRGPGQAPISGRDISE